MRSAIHESASNQLFSEARSYSEWSDEPVAEQTLRAVYEQLKWGPTAFNSCPARFVWVRSAAGKAKVAALAMEFNRAKILAAPVTVIVGNDFAFADTVPKLNPERAAMIVPLLKQSGIVAETAMRSGSLQGAYLIIAARALGLDCGPMSGFNNAAVDETFFAGTQIQSNFICSIGYGKPGTPRPRNLRLTFEEAGWFA